MPRTVTAVIEKRAHKGAMVIDLCKIGAYYGVLKFRGCLRGKKLPGFGILWSPEPEADVKEARLYLTHFMASLAYRWKRWRNGYKEIDMEE